MKKFAVAAVVAFALSVGSASAADLVTKAKKVVAPEPPAWDVAFGAAIASDYVFRGITQSAHKPSIAAYFEPRYNINKDNQIYAGIGGASIDFANRPAGEIDFYAGWRPTIDKLALDFGAWYYWYPGGQCFGGAAFPTCSAGFGAPPQSLPNGNTVKNAVSFWEVYAKGNYTVTDAFSVGFNVYWSPNVLNTGADGLYYSGTAKYVFPALANGMQFYTSGEIGRWDLGTSDLFYANAMFPTGVPYASYTTWNVGFGWTWKVFTVDLRYIDTDLSKGDCNAFTADHTATGTTNVTPINLGGLGSNWCSPAFVARLSADLTINTNLK